MFPFGKPSLAEAKYPCITWLAHHSVVVCARNVIQLVMPEDTLTLTIPTHSAKVLTLTAFCYGELSQLQKFYCLEVSLYVRNLFSHKCVLKWIMLLYEGRSINKLQNSVILLVFQILKNPKYTFCREFNSEYQLSVLLQ